MTTRSWQFRATEEIRLGQNEANSEDSSVLLQESMEKILRQIVNLYDTLAFPSSTSTDMILYEQNCWWFPSSNKYGSQTPRSLSTEGRKGERILSQSPVNPRVGQKGFFCICALTHTHARMHTRTCIHTRTCTHTHTHTPPPPPPPLLPCLDNLL